MAQAFPIFQLAEIFPEAVPVTSITSFVPGTSIPIQVSTTFAVTRSGDLLGWLPGTSGLRNDWTITFGAPTRDVEITLVDFDRITGTAHLETLAQLDPTLGAPTSLVTTAAQGNGQMVYQPAADGGRILHAPLADTNAGTAVAYWSDANVSVITFTTTRSSNGLGQLIGVRLGDPEAAPIPEPTSLLLLGGGLACAACLTRRRKRPAS